MKSKSPEWVSRLEVEQAARRQPDGGLYNYLVTLMASVMADKLRDNHMDFLLTDNYRTQGMNEMRKRADGGIANDLAGDALYGGLGGDIGSLVGWFAGKPSKERMRKWDEHPGLSWLPGVGRYRAMRKALDTVGNEGEKTKRVRSRILSENFGQSTSAWLLAAALGAIGAGAAVAAGGKDYDVYLNNRRVMSLPVLSGIAGATLGRVAAAGANRIGGLVGAARKRRTELEQQEADTKSQAPAWLLPGVAAYRKARRLPSIVRREDRRNQEAEDRKKAEDGEVQA